MPIDEPKFEDTTPVDTIPSWDDTEDINVKKKVSSDASLDQKLPSESVGKEDTSKSPNKSGDYTDYAKNLIYNLPEQKTSVNDGTYQFEQNPQPTKDEYTSKYQDKFNERLNTRWKGESPDQMVRSFMSWQTKLTEKYTPLIKQAKTKDEINKISDEYSKELDQAANKEYMEKTTDEDGSVGYKLKKNIVDDYEKELKSANQYAVQEVGVPENKDKSYLNSLYYKLGIGSKRVMSDLTNALDFVVPYKKLLHLEDDAQYEKMVYDEMGKKAKYYDNTASEFIKRGQIGKALGSLALDVTEMTPMLATIYMGGEAGLARQVIGTEAVGAGVTKYDQIKDLNIPQSAKIYNAMMTSLNFAALGEIGGNQIMQSAKNLTTKFGEEKAKDLLAKSLNSRLQNASQIIAEGTSPALKGFGIGATTQLSSNIVDKATIDPNKDINEGVIDSGLLFAFMDKAMGLHKDVAKAKEAIDIAKGKIPKDIPIEDYATSLDMILDKDFITEQNKTLDNAFQSNKVNEIDQKLNVVSQPRLVKEKISLLNKNISDELAKEYPDVNKITEFDGELSAIEQSIKVKSSPEVEVIDKKIEGLRKEREGLYKEELTGTELQKQAKEEKRINTQLSSLLKQKQAIKQKFYDEPLKGIDDSFDKDIHREEKNQAHDELKQTLPDIKNVEQLKPEKNESENERNNGRKRNPQTVGSKSKSREVGEASKEGSEVKSEDNAKEVRGDQESSIKEGEKPKKSEDVSGENLQRDKEAGTKASDAEDEVIPEFVPEGMGEPEPSGTKTAIKLGEKEPTLKGLKNVVGAKGKEMFTKPIMKENNRIGDISYEDKGNERVIKRFDIDKEQQGKGFGKETVRQLAKEAQSESKILVSDKANMNNENSVRVYESLVKSGEAKKLSDNSYRILPEKAPTEKVPEPKIGDQIGFKDMVGTDRKGEVQSFEDGKYKIKAEDGSIHRVKVEKLQSVDEAEKAIKKAKELKSETRSIIPVSEAPKAKEVKASTIISKLEKELNIPIRIGKIRQKALGIFKVEPEVIRTREANDLAVTSHEVAHYIDKKLKISDNILGKAKKELEDLDYDQSKKRVNEGLAEFFRHYMTVGDAKTVAPEFYDYFKKEILGKNKNEAKIINEATDLITQWREQGSLARVLSQVDFNGLKSNKTFNEKLKSFDTRMRSRFANRLYPLKYVVNEILGKTTIRPSDNPYSLAMSVAKTASAKARQFIMDESFDFGLNKVGKSLKEVVSPVSKDIKEAIAYAYSKHSISLLDRGVNPGIMRGDAEYVLKNNYKPEYEQFSKDFTEWSSKLVDYLVDAGGLSKGAAKIMRDTNPFYIPLKRSFADSGVSASKGKGYTDLSSPIKRIKGSGREIVNPLESMIAMTEQIISIADRSRVSRALVDLSEKYEGMGKWVEKVPAPMQKTMVELESISKQIESLGGDMSGVDKDAIINIFSQGNYYGKDNIVSIYRNGKREFYQLHKDLYDSMKGLDAVHLPWFVDYVFGKPSRLVRLGATGIRAGFSLITNPIRDFQTFVLQNEYTGTSRVGNVGKSIIQELAGKGKYGKEFKRSGGEMAQPLGLDRKMLQNAVEEVLADGTKSKALGIIKHPIEALRKVLSFTEAGTRMAEFESVMKKYEPLFEKAKSNGDLVELKKLQEDAAIEASNASNEVTVNFKRAGTYGAVINQVVPFFNPAVQGISRMGRTVYEHPVRSGFRAIAFMTAPTLALWYLHKDEKWYQEMPDWQKYGFWNFKIGDEIVRLPKPFEWGYLFGAVPEGIANSIYTKDPESVKNASVESAGAMLPPMMPALVKPAMEVYFNWDIFRDAPLISKSQEGLLPAQQYTSHTSKLAIELGSILDVSPINIDHLLSGYTGGLATDILRAFPKEYKEKADLPIIGRLFTRASTVGFGGNSVQKFYDQFTRLSSIEKTLSFAKKNDIKPRNISKDDYKLYEYKYLVAKTAKELTVLRNKLSDIDKVKMDHDIKAKVVVEINDASAKLAKETLDKIKVTKETPKEFVFVNTINKFDKDMSDIDEAFKSGGAEEMSRFVQENKLSQEVEYYKKNKKEFNKLKKVIDYAYTGEYKKEYESVIRENAEDFMNAYNSDSKFKVNRDLNKVYRQLLKENKISEREKSKVVRDLD